MVQAKEFRLGRTFVGRLPEEGDLVEALEEFARQRGVRAGWVSAIGTVRRAVVGFFDHQRREYRRIPVEEFREIVSCQGNVSLKEGKPMVHVHVVLSGPDGQSVAGHLFESTIFVGEFWLQEVEGEELERRPDAQSGLSLWAIEGAEDR